MNIEPLEAAYLAGLFDGEGYISGTYLDGRPSLQVAISMTVSGPIQRLRELFGGCYLEYTPKISDRCKLVYALQLGGASSKPLLECLLPYLKVKRKEAVLALAFIDTVGTFGEKTSDRTKLFRHKIVELLRELKK